MRTIICLALFIIITLGSGCEDKEVTRIKAHGYNPPIPTYNVVDFCAAAVSNSSMNLSVRTLLEICIHKEDDAKDKLYKMQEKGKPIIQENWASCLETSVGQYGEPSKNGSYSILYDCAVGKTLPTKKPVLIQSSGEPKERKFRAKEGKEVLNKILSRHKRLDKSYLDPYVSGGGTSNPLCCIIVPSSDWKSLPESNKDALADYAASLISKVKANPLQYSGVSPGAPAASFVSGNISKMSSNSWCIFAGQMTPDGKDIGLDYTAKSGQ